MMEDRKLCGLIDQAYVKLRDLIDMGDNKAAIEAQKIELERLKFKREALHACGYSSAN